MVFRRLRPQLGKSALRARQSVERASRAAAPHRWLESLEQRLLLTTVHGGDTFSYGDGAGSTYNVVLQGNITAELIGAEVDTSNNVALVDLPGTINGSSVNGGIITASGGPIYSLYAIYVSSSDIGASIAVAKVGGTDAGAYKGSIGSLTITNSTTGMGGSAAAPANSGGALLGALTTFKTPILSQHVSGSFGVLPGSVTTLTPGLTVAAGNDLGSFLFGGTVTGDVAIHGSINTFYCGWLVTGNAGGNYDPDNFIPPTRNSQARNFTVDGNIRDLIVSGDIGTDSLALTQLVAPDYFSGVDIYVGGSAGVIQTFGAFAGNVDVVNDPNITPLTGPQNEFDQLTGSFGQGVLGNDVRFNNDTYATAQYLGYAAGGVVGVNGELTDTGLTPDLVDYYAVPLMAGQTVTAQAYETDPFLDFDLLHTGVFDPDGRLVASDYSTSGEQYTQEQPFSFTADRPGVYRFAVGFIKDSAFTGDGYEPGDKTPYNLTISGLGDLGLGEVVAGATVMDVGGAPDGAGSGPSSIAGFGVERGDLGAIVAKTSVLSNMDGTIGVDDGNVRAIVGATIGFGQVPATLITPDIPPALDPTIDVPNGSVGLISASGPDLFFNYPHGGGSIPAIGGNYEIVSSAGNFAADLVADGNIGTIRAASMSYYDIDAGFFSVNAGNSSTPGVIDLIDVTGDLGTLNRGGPGIRTGSSGNVRYMHVGGTVYRDEFFGGGSPDSTLYSPGETVTLVDDSGSIVELTPTDPTEALTITTYGIEGSGGSAIVDVQSPGGLGITTSGNASGQTAEIGEIDVSDSGNAVTLPAPPDDPGPSKTLPLPPAPVIGTDATAVGVTITGSGRVDVFDISGAAFDSITNSTNGEMPTIEAVSIGTLSTNGTLGLMQSHTAAAVLPVADLSDDFPFDQQHNGIVVSGSIVSAHAGRGLGNFIVSGSVGSINAGGNGLGTFKGINGPIMVTGDVNSVDVGDGISFSGSGSISLSGLYVVGQLGVVSNSHPANIRGNIISELGISGINLTNGSIINATIGNYTDFTYSAATYSDSAEVPGGNSPVDNPIWDLGPVTTTGNGGVIGSEFVFDNMGPLTINGGFGAINDTFRTVGAGTFAGITADGYGIRGIVFNGGASLGTLNARGNGSDSPVTNYSAAVRQSELYAIDPNFQAPPNALTDLDIALGASAATPSVPGATDTGVIENFDGVGSRNLTTVTAYKIRATDPLNDPSTFNFANTIGSITTHSAIDGMDITTGKLKSFNPGGDISDLAITIAGPIGAIQIHGSVTDASSIRAVGPNGSIGSIKIDGSMAGTISAQRAVGKVVIGGTLSGTLSGASVKNLVIGGLATSLAIEGNIGSILCTGNLGSGIESLTVDGTLKSLKVLGDLEANVSASQLNKLNVNGSVLGGVALNVTGKTGSVRVNQNFDGIFATDRLVKLAVFGSVITGTSIDVTGILNNLVVKGDVQAGATITAARIVHQRVFGQTAGTITG